MLNRIVYEFSVPSLEERGGRGSLSREEAGALWTLRLCRQRRPWRLTAKPLLKIGLGVV